jgi:hypothetical protein
MYYNLKYRCLPKTTYYVTLGKFIDQVGGGWGNLTSTHSLGRARFYAKKAKLKFRQIDVKTRGKEHYVLQSSWN